MVLKNKYHPDGTLERKKARIVARGFSQRPDVYFNETFAPVARLNSIRLLMSLAAQHKMTIRQFDITTAYLNGLIEEELFMETPHFLKEALEIIGQTEGKSRNIAVKAHNMLND